MTEPGTSGTRPGNTGASNTGPGTTGASNTGPGSMGPGSTGPGSAGPGSTATEARTTPGQASVPPQVGHAAAADTTIEAERGHAYGTGVSVISGAAGMSWAAVVFGGLAMIAVGVMLLVWPSASLTVVAILIGAAIVASGVVKLYEGFTAKAESGGMRAAYVVIGLLAVIVGIYCIRVPTVTVFLLAFVTGLYFIMHGIADIGVSVSAPRGMPGKTVRAVLGVFSIGAGIVMVVWPAISLVILFTLVAAWLLFYGVALCVLAFSLRRGTKTAASKSRSAPVLAAQ
jgi:uncharacterized membrane protein HdeD (DUF308 family)